MDFTGCFSPYSSGTSCSGNRCGGVSSDGLGASVFGIKIQVPADSKLFESSLFLARFFTAGLRLVLLEMRQCGRLWLLTDEGMVTAFQTVSNIFLHVFKNLKLIRKKKWKVWKRRRIVHFCIGESQGWLNEHLQNHTPLQKDGRVSCIGDPALVPLQQPPGRGCYKCQGAP